jgi:two-component system nitrogen regulation sensor histidine kinase GlnL
MKNSARDELMRSLPAPAATKIAWEDVLANFTDAVVVLDNDRRVVLFNQAAEVLTGKPQAKALGQACSRVFPQTPLISEIVSRVRENGQSESRTEETLLSRGKQVPVRITCLPFWDTENRLRGTSLIIHDLSHQKALEESARRNENLARLGTLVAGLAHEVRNPLAGIKGAAQLLQGRLGDHPDLCDYTAVITREVDRLSSLVENLLNLGAPPKPRFQRLNVHRVVRDVVKLIEEELTRREIRLRCDFDPSLPEIQGDPEQLNQVFLNLVKNSIEAMSSDGKVAAAPMTLTISTHMETDFHILRERDRASKFLRIEVADQGQGIEPTHAARIFEPFFSTKPRGTGLGLAISQRIVAEHGGTMRAVANRPHGTVIKVTLPVVSS